MQRLKHRSQLPVWKPDNCEKFRGSPNTRPDHPAWNKLETVPGSILCAGHRLTTRESVLKLYHTDGISVVDSTVFHVSGGSLALCLKGKYSMLLVNVWRPDTSAISGPRKCCVGRCALTKNMAEDWPRAKMRSKSIAGDWPKKKIYGRRLAGESDPNPTSFPKVYQSGAMCNKTAEYFSTNMIGLANWR